MNILLAGYGSVGKAVHTLLQAYPLAGIDSIRIAEKKTGPSAESVLTEYKDNIDLVINLTDADSPDLLTLCKKYAVHYLDTGLAYIDDLAVLEVPPPPGLKFLFGFGMNPGLIEFMYRAQNVSEPHTVLEMEHDSAASGLKLFATWSPAMFYAESVAEAPIIYSEARVLSLSRSGNRPDLVTDFLAGVPRRYLWTPHEEIVAMGRGNPHCRFSGFLYSAPDALLSLALECRKSGAPFPEDIPVPDNLEGEDVIGLLLAYDSGRADFVCNRKSHADAYAQLGMNGTIWQVACGVYAGISLFPHLPPGGYTMSGIPEEYLDIVRRCLETLSFTMETHTIRLPEEVRSLSVTTGEGETIPCFRPSPSTAQNAGMQPAKRRVL